ncbi:MAG: hypothetical protein ACLRZ9_05825 [Eubacterium sp.]
MRTLAKNKQPMKYALQISEIPIYVTDENGEIEYDHYTDSEGNKIYYFDKDGNKIPLEAGGKEVLYSTPKDFKANISMSGGEAEAKEYGLSIADYEAVLNYGRGEFPLVEGALIWFGSKVEYKYDGKEIEVETDNGTVKTKVPIKESADFQVLKVPQSINEEKAILGAVNK